MKNTEYFSVVQRHDSDDRFEVIQRTMINRFDQQVAIIDKFANKSEIYFLLSKLTDGIPVNFIMIAHIKKKVRLQEQLWEIRCFFEKDTPSFYNCPQSFFDQCPTKNIKTLAWRDRVYKVRNGRQKFYKSNTNIYKLAEKFHVGDSLSHPTYGLLQIQHIDLKARAFWCLNEKHTGVRKYKLPLMPLEYWQLNLNEKNAQNKGCTV